MSELLPYEEQLAGKLADITLPDETQGWDAMRKMLDDDDDGILPPPVNTGCRNRGLAGLLLLLAGLLVTVVIYTTLNRHKGTLAERGAVHAKEAAKGAGQDTVAKMAVTRAAKDTADGLAAVKIKDSVAEKITAKKDISGAGGNGVKDISNASLRITKRGGLAAVDGNEGSKAGKDGVSRFNAKTAKPAGDINAVPPVNAGNVKAVTRDNGHNETVSGKIPVDETVQKIKKDTSTALSNNAVPANITKANIGTGVAVKQNGMPNAKKDAAAAIKKTAEPDEKEGTPDNKIWLSGGLGLQQLIPVDGQKASPYNAFGRKGTLADYVPSLYVRLHQNRKFLQVEFKYGAPQYTKDIAYSTKIINYDSTTRITSSTVNHVKKTWYHQLPISLHYEVLPNLSLGVGAVLNKFQSAEVNQQLHSSNGLTGTDSVLSSKVITVKSDSSFAKTYWQFMGEAQYAIGRFSFGARYSFGLQPYLIYTSPTGQTQKERNASLNVFVRFELLRPKKK